MRPERALPAFFAIAALLLWQGAVRMFDVPLYIVPGPIAVAQAFLEAPTLLLRSLAATMLVTAAALAASIVLGVVLAGSIALSRWARRRSYHGRSCCRSRQSWRSHR